ncbi:hypothetical protein BT69DRAFT_1347146 [Atractiella rhizophila]|nr:hypothetical protein BT69DRAFT_1347146 [Atractiella rhizophila]
MKNPRALILNLQKSNKTDPPLPSRFSDDDPFSPFSPAHREELERGVENREYAGRLYSDPFSLEGLDDHDEEVVDVSLKTGFGRRMSSIWNIVMRSPVVPYNRESRSRKSSVGPTESLTSSTKSTKSTFQFPRPPTNTSTPSSTINTTTATKKVFFPSLFSPTAKVPPAAEPSIPPPVPPKEDLYCYDFTPPSVVQPATLSSPQGLPPLTTKERTQLENFSFPPKPISVPMQKRPSTLPPPGAPPKCPLPPIPSRQPTKEDKRSLDDQIGRGMHGEDRMEKQLPPLLDEKPALVPQLIVEDGNPSIIPQLSDQSKSDEEAWFPPRMKGNIHRSPRTTFPSYSSEGWSDGVIGSMSSSLEGEEEWRGEEMARADGSWDRQAAHVGGLTESERKQMGRFKFPAVVVDNLHLLSTIRILRIRYSNYQSPI